MLTVTRSRIALAALLAWLVIGALAATPALAEPGNGAIHLSDANCHDDDGYTTCMTATGVVNETITPAGNAIYTGNIRTTFVVTDPSGVLVYEGSGESHFQRLEQDGLLQMLSNQARSTMTRADGTVCTSIYAVHLANGAIQFEHSATECR